MAYIHRPQPKHFPKKSINMGTSKLPEKLVKQRRMNRKEGIKGCELIVDKILGIYYINKTLGCTYCKNGSCHKGEPLPTIKPKFVPISQWELI